MPCLDLFSTDGLLELPPLTREERSSWCIPLLRDERYLAFMTKEEQAANAHLVKTLLTRRPSLWLLTKDRATWSDYLSWNERLVLGGMAHHPDAENAGRVIEQLDENSVQWIFIDDRAGTIRIRDKDSKYIQLKDRALIGELSLLDVTSSCYRSGELIRLVLAKKPDELAFVTEHEQLGRCDLETVLIDRPASLVWVKSPTVEHLRTAFETDPRAFLLMSPEQQQQALDENDLITALAKYPWLWTYISIVPTARMAHRVISTWDRWMMPSRADLEALGRVDNWFKRPNTYYAINRTNRLEYAKNKYANEKRKARIEGRLSKQQIYYQQNKERIKARYHAGKSI